MLKLSPQIRNGFGDVADKLTAIGKAMEPVSNIFNSILGPIRSVLVSAICFPPLLPVDPSPEPEMLTPKQEKFGGWTKFLEWPINQIIDATPLKGLIDDVVHKIENRVSAALEDELRNLEKPIKDNLAEAERVFNGFDEVGPRKLMRILAQH
jgi:hypothetical protein